VEAIQKRVAGLESQLAFNALKAQRQKEAAKAMHRPERFCGTMKDKNNRIAEI